LPERARLSASINVKVDLPVPSAELVISTVVLSLPPSRDSSAVRTIRTDSVVAGLISLPCDNIGVTGMYPRNGTCIG